MSILKQNFFAYCMAVGSIFSCAAWQSSCNILEASSRLWAAISGAARQGYFISPIVLARLPSALQRICWAPVGWGGGCSLLQAQLCSGGSAGVGPAPKNGCGAHLWPCCWEGQIFPVPTGTEFSEQQQQNLWGSNGGAPGWFQASPSSQFAFWSSASSPAPGWGWDPRAGVGLVQSSRTAALPLLSTQSWIL